MQIRPSPRTRLRRNPQRASHDAELLHRILDDAPMVHVATTTSCGPLLLPMAHGRIGDRLYLHGALANGLLRTILAGAQACISATLLDGLILARSAMHHSMAYRCAVVFSHGSAVDNEDEQRRALRAILEHNLPGRAAETRPPNAEDLRATLVVRFSLDEASVKVRDDQVHDAPEDLDLPYFAGCVPLRTATGLPVTQSQSPDSRAIEQAMLRHAPKLSRTSAGPLELDGDPLRYDLDRVLTWLRDESYWASDLTRQALVRSITNSTTIGAYEQGRQVGFARVVTDSATFGWLADVFVAHEARGRGVASAMIRRLRELHELAGVRKWTLATRDAHGLYERFGFVPVPPGSYMVAPLDGAP